MAPKKGSGSSPLESLGVDIFKQYPGPEQVELKVVVNVPGSWFGGTAMGGLNPSERREFYEAQAVEAAAVREFKGVGGAKKTKEAAIRFICISDAMDQADHEGFWMKLTTWNRYRHHTYKDRRNDELPFITDRKDDVVQLVSDAKETSKPEAKIREHFDVVETGTHEQKNGQVVPCTWYNCRQPHCKCKEPIKEVRKNTGLLYRHLKKCNPGLWRELKLTSKHSKLVIGEDGSDVELWSFEESLPSHIRFVEHCFEDFEVFFKARSKSLRRWASTLNPRAGLPHRKTCTQILGVIRTLIETKLQCVIDVHVGLYDAPCFGKQADIWSEKSMREAFFAARLSMQLEPQLVYTAGSTGLATHSGSLIDAAPMITFMQFTESSHSGPVIARINKEALAKFRLLPTHITLNTEDGAANNKKAAKILGWPFKVCFPHDLQRAILFSTGMTGSPSQNPDLAEEIKKMSAMAAAPHRSVQTTQSLVEAQEENGVKKSQALTTSTMNVTRWQGLYKMANKNRRLEKELKLSLTGSEAGLDGMEEDPAEVEEGDSSDSDESAAKGKDGEDEDEPQIQANIAADKKFPLAHRCLSSDGFKNGALLESVLTHPHEVSCLTQKHEGMGLSLGYQMAVIVHDCTTAARVSIVSGSSKEGEWKEVHSNTLPSMFQKKRKILAAQIDQRFKVTGTPDKPTLLALAMDPSVDTSHGGLFSSRSAAQELLEGEYRRGLMRCGLKLSQKHTQLSSPKKASSSTASSSTASSSTALGKRPLVAPKVSSSKKGPASILSLIKAKSTVESSAKSPADDRDALLDAVKAEETKYASISQAVQADPSAFDEKGIFNQSKFWTVHKQALPIHYALWVAEVGCAKVASANIETVFSGAGRISMKSRKLSPSILSDYAICHYNYKYDWLRPSLDEIVKAYKKLYGKGGKLEEAESSDDSSGDSEEEESEKEEEGDEEEEDGEE